MSATEPNVFDDGKPADYRHPDAMPSGAAINLDAERRAAQEQSERAKWERFNRYARAGTVRQIGTVGTQTGRLIEVVRAQEAIALRDPAVTINGGILAPFDAEQTGQFVDMLSEAIHPDRLNRSEHHGLIGRVPTLPLGKRPAGTILVERGASIVIRDVSRDVRPDTDNSLVTMNANQAAALRDTLAMAIGR